MKHEYVEGARATENFEQGMKALFKVPKSAVERAKPKKKAKRISSDKSKRSDKD
jgi:hypothetical protein